MPTYEYECKNCGHSFEIFQKMRDDPLKTCPKCGKEVHRLIAGGGGIIFKGPGFYATDSRNTAGKSGKETGRKESSPPAACEACPHNKTPESCPAASGERPQTNG